VRQSVCDPTGLERQGYERVTKSKAAARRAKALCVVCTCEHVHIFRVFLNTAPELEHTVVKLGYLS
jgi:hypothetical protein